MSRPTVSITWWLSCSRRVSCFPQIHSFANEPSRTRSRMRRIATFVSWVRSCRPPYSAVSETTWPYHRNQDKSRRHTDECRCGESKSKPWTQEELNVRRHPIKRQPVRAPLLSASRCVYVVHVRPKVL